MKRRFPLWQPVLFLILIVSLACSQGLPGVPSFLASPVPTATPIPLPPTIIETIPPVGSQIPLQAPLTVYFSEKMERASVESAFSADSSSGFVFNWIDDSTLTLAPKTALPASSQVTFSLAASARSAGGLAMLRPASLTYHTPGPLKVSQILPASASVDVSPDSAVVVSFNQPVVALGPAPSTLPAGLTLDPPAQGRGEWLNTSTYIFHAEPALAGDQLYTVQVNPALVSTSGMPLELAGPAGDWTFITSLPQVLTVEADNTANMLNIDASIKVTFNQPMDNASVEQGFSLEGPGGKVGGLFDWNKKFTVLTFKPSALLARGARYNLLIDSRVRSKGGAPLGSETRVGYVTVAPFSVITTSFPNGQLRPLNISNAVTFTAPLAQYTDSELNSLITISPKIAYGGFYVDGATVNINGGFLPGVTYAVTFSSALKDRWDDSLGADYVFTFIEPDAQPDLSLATYSPVMFTRPDDPNLSVQAVNVSAITVSRGAMSLDDFLRTQADYNLRQAFTPADNQSFTIQPATPRNANQPVTINLSDSPLAPGFYGIDLDAPELRSHGYNRRTLVVSNINVTFKLSPTQALLWAIDLRTQAPVKNAPVVLYDQKTSRIAAGLTDDQGLWRGDIPRGFDLGIVYAILGQPGDDRFGVAMSSWDLGIAPWDFGLRVDTGGPRLETYLYSERPVYRPGDVVRYRGVLRTWYDGRYTAPALASLGLAWYGPNGRLSEGQVTLSAYGTFNGEFTLAPDAIPGGYSMNVTTDGVDIYNGALYFQVADYRKPEINLSASLSPDPLVSGAPLTATVTAAYFFGSPVPDLPFTWRLYSQADYFSIPEYSTGVRSSRWLSDDTQARLGNIYRTGEARTGPDGTFTIPLADITVADTRQLTIEVTASESGGFPVSVRASALVHPADFYIGVRPAAWVGQAGLPLAFSLLSVDWERKPVSRPLTVAFQKVRWERADFTNAGMFEFTPVYTPVDSKTVTTAADGAASLSFTPPDPGTYILDVTSQVAPGPARGGKAHTQTLIWVGGGQDAEWPNLPYQQVQITADKDGYKPGDTARVFIPNPFNAPALALLTSERSTLKSVQVVTVPAAGYTLSLPLTDDSAPNIYVSATLLGPQGVDFRQGYLNLPVEPSAFSLNVDLKATPEHARPGDTLTLDLAVTDSKGQPVQGEFSLAVVDLAALALADPNSSDIIPAYYDIQSLGVTTGLTAAVYTRRLLNFVGGGGGGGGDGSLTLREKFPDTAYWKADIVTDAAGRARITLTLPDNLTTWQVDTRGLTTDTRVGQARVRVVTGKELLIRPQTPRFLVVGDHAELAAMLNNTTSAPLAVTASLQASNFTLDDPALAEQKLTIPANARARLSWSGLVQDGETVDAIFNVKSGAFQDASRPTDGPIPVLRYSAPLTFSTAGQLTGLATVQEIIALPRTFQPLGGDLQLELSPSLAAVILGALKAVESPARPWNTEQVVSAFLPNVLTYRALKDSGLDDPGLDARLQTNLLSGLRRLLAAQREDGSWAWTDSSSSGDLYLSAYVLFGLQQASLSGADLQDLELDPAIERGRAALFSADPFTGVADLKIAWQADRAAFYCYVLALTGGLGDYNSVAGQLYENRDFLDPWARAMLALSLHAISPVDARVATLLSDLESTAIRSATGAHWQSAPTGAGFISASSPLFTTAVVLNALSERAPASPLAADAARYLASQRDAAGAWASSYETSWVILALNRYMQSTGELRGDFTYSALLNGAPLAQGQASGPGNLASVTAGAPLTALNLAGANSLLVSKQDGAGRLYYRAALTVDRPVESAPAVSQGISLSRRFMDCTTILCQPVTSYQLQPNQSGQVAVKLTVTLPEDAYYLVVQDYIPAGADILDSSLKTSQQGGPDQAVEAVRFQFDPSDPFSDGWGWWLFNRPQIYSDHILWSADYLPAGAYQLTYTIIPSLAGQYRVLPARAWLAYFPELQGATSGAIFEIKP